MNSSNFDPAEIAKFSNSAAHWWDLQGDYKALHEINPLRIDFIKSKICLKDKNVIDVGCGGGILTESLAKLGATMTGIDMSKEALMVAKLHQLESALSINYELITAEEMAQKNPGKYDSLTCLELLEHVPDPLSTIKACASMVKEGGDIFFSTLNRNFKSYLFAIVGAEYILNLLPKNTHDYAKFIKPSELATLADQAGLSVKDIIGITYNPFTKTYKLSSDISVNYLMYLKK